MSLLRFNNYKKIYLNSMPTIFKFSSITGLLTGIYANVIQEKSDNQDKRELETYANLIGYTTLGMITGLTYPISFPFFTYYAFYKNDKLSKIFN
jgi:hypothetical protein